MTTLFREVKRKASVGERIRIVNPMFAHTYGKDDVGTVISSGPPGVTARIDGKSGDRGIWHREYVVLEPVTPAPPQQLDFLEAIALFMRENAAAVRKYLDEIAPEKAPVMQSKPLTRAEVIAKAKADVAELLRIGDDIRSDLPKGTPFHNKLYTVEFHVNRNKRAVVALVRGYLYNRIYARGIAKCAPGDVFHAEIGKAIALRRALGLPVPDEYINAPRPDEPRVGARVRGTVTGIDATVTHIERGSSSPYRGHYVDGDALYVPAHLIEIIDDTDVDYKEAA